MLEITPEELFFLGKYMHAKYIDYEYIKQMKDLQKNYALRKDETMAALVNKGYLNEDFFGTMELEPEAEHLLTPVFLGECEAEIIMKTRLDEKKEIYKIHFYQGDITVVSLQDRYLCVYANGSEQIELLKNRIIQSDYIGEKSTMSAKQLQQIFDRIVVLNKVLVGKKAAHRQILESGGIWYIGKEKGNAEGLDRSELEALWKELVEAE